jgi:hypothetical protein
MKNIIPKVTNYLLISAFLLVLVIVVFKLMPVQLNPILNIANPKKEIFVEGENSNVFINNDLIEVANNILSVNLSGYKETCLSSIDLYKKNNGEFKKVESQPEYFHYIDDDMSTNYCDVIFCKKIDSPYQIELIEFKKIGERVVPDNFHRLSGSKLPVYHTNNIITDEVKINIKYFSDPECTIPQYFSKVIENRF